MEETDAECLDSGAPCEVCQFGHPRSCPILGDPEYRSFVLYLRDRSRQQAVLSQLLHGRLVEILRRHKRPLHYQMIQRIYARKFADYPITDRGVYRILSNDPAVDVVEEGVYTLRRGANR